MQNVFSLIWFKRKIISNEETYIVPRCTLPKIKWKIRRCNNEKKSGIIRSETNRYYWESYLKSYVYFFIPYFIYK